MDDSRSIGISEHHNLFSLKLDVSLSEEGMTSTCVCSDIRGEKLADYEFSDILIVGRNKDKISRRNCVLSVGDSRELGYIIADLVTRKEDFGSFFMALLLAFNMYLGKVNDIEEEADHATRH